MANNRLLLPKTASDIDQRIDRVLRGLGNPEPPLRLEDARELLKLDLAFYTANNPSAAQETISRIRVATLQVLQRPTILIDAIKKMSLKALYLPDRKRILLDGDLPRLKHRWNEAHEIGHSLIPWHEDAMLGDNVHTLSRDCHEQVEAEANFAAGRLLFLRDRFAEEARDHEPVIASLQKLSGSYGNSISSTLYRFVEVMGAERPMIGLITDHPHPSRRSQSFNPAEPCRHVIRSPAFLRRFSTIADHALFSVLAGYCGSQRAGPLGSADILLTDANGDQHHFRFETFFNRYDALTLGLYLAPRFTIKAA